MMNNVYSSFLKGGISLITSAPRYRRIHRRRDCQILFRKSWSGHIQANSLADTSCGQFHMAEIGQCGGNVDPPSLVENKHIFYGARFPLRKVILFPQGGLPFLWITTITLCSSITSLPKPIVFITSVWTPPERVDIIHREP